MATEIAKKAAQEILKNRWCHGMKVMRGEAAPSQGTECDLAKIIDAAGVAELVRQRDAAIEALAAICCLPDGWCCCPSDRGESRPSHTGECLAARKVLKEADCARARKETGCN